MKKQTLIDPLLTGMYDPMPDGLRPSVDQTPPDVLYEKYEQGFERAVEFMRRDMPPLVEVNEDHAGKRWCAECDPHWQNEDQFAKECGWMCRKHWLAYRAEYMRGYRAKHKTEKLKRKLDKRKARQNNQVEV
jgi:hypothetical protein